MKKFSGTVLNLAQGGSGNNYFHFFFDIIPKIYLIQKKLKKKLIFIMYLLLKNGKLKYLKF